MKIHGKSLICSQTWSKSELDKVLEIAIKMKRNPLDDRWTALLKNKSFLMFFHNPSLRTHISFETAAIQLGGSAQYRSPNMGWVKTKIKSGENLKDVVKVMSRYVDGIGVRLTMDAISHYGEAYETLLKYVEWSDVPIINMACDRFHPCQALADLLAWSEWLGKGKDLEETNIENLKGKKLLLTWAKSGLTRPWSSVQSHLLLASRFGMDITLARPDGYDLDPEVYAWIKQNCKTNATNFNIINNPDDGYEDANVVFVRNWISPNAYQNGKLQTEVEIEKALKHKDWITTADRMEKTDNGIFANPMPVDRGNEATDEVVDGPRSAIYDIAENRLHVQKAVMGLTMSTIENNEIMGN